MTGIIDGRYRIVSELGSGGSGTVYRVADLAHDERILALKVLSYGAQRQREKLLRFRREFRAASRLKHPCIVDVYDFVAGRMSYFTMELVTGSSVARYFASKERWAGELNHPRRVAQVFTVLHQIAVALDYLRGHQLVHRDLKPDNILVVDAPADGGTTPLVKIMDFGLARDLRDATQLTQPGVVLGTLAYVSPEQATSRTVDGRADLYALGVILYLLLTGGLPFTTDTVSSILWKQCSQPPEPPRVRNPGVNRLLEAMCLRLLRKDPFERYQTPTELLRSIARGAPYPLPDAIRTLAPDSLVRETRVFAPKLTGRSRELKRLREIAASAVRGEPRTVVIAGERGSGRTRLLEELLAGGSEIDARLIYGRFAAADPRPLAGFHAPVSALADLYESLPMAVAERRLGDDIALIASAFPSLQRVEAARRSRARVGVTRDAFLDALAKLFAGALPSGALVLQLDGIDSADTRSLELIDRLRAIGTISSGSGVEHALALVITATAEHGDVLTRRWPDAERIDLAPANRSELTLMIRSMLGTDAVAAEVVDFVCAISAGSPGAAEEVVRAMILEGQLVRRTDGFVLERSAAPIASASDAATRRVLAMPAEPRELLEIAALVPRDVGFELLVQATGHDESDAIDAVDALLKSGLLVEGHEEGSLLIAAELTRHAVLSALEGPRAAPLMGRIATTFDELYGDAECELIADFARRAGDGGLAARHAERARQRWLTLG